MLHRYGGKLQNAGAICDTHDFFACYPPPVGFGRKCIRLTRPGFSKVRLKQTWFTGHQVKGFCRKFTNIIHQTLFLGSSNHWGVYDTSTL